MVGRNMNELWVELQKIFEIVFDPTPMWKDIEHLRQRCGLFHANYAICFILERPTRF